MARKSNNDLIAEALNINPLEISKNAAPVVIEPRAHPMTKFEEDLDLARGNIIKLIGVGTDNLELLSQIAQSTEHPRAFEVVSTLINTMLSANKDLIDLHRQARDITSEDSPDGPDKVTNNLFVGTTEEALAMIRARRNGENQDKQD